jgi:hypothetical protein
MNRTLFFLLLICATFLILGCERIKHNLGDPQEPGTYVMYEEPRVTYTYEVDPNDPPTSHLK